MRMLIAIAISVAFMSIFAPVYAAEQVIGQYEYGPIAYPRGTGKMIFEATIIVSGKAVTKTVEVPKGDIKPWTRPLRVPTDTDAQYAQKLADARAAASQAKAKVIGDAINKAYEKEFKGTTLQVTVANFAKTETINVGGTLIKDVTANYGSLLIPGVAENAGQPLKFSENGVLGEGGNGGRFLAPAKPSPGTRGSLERMIPGVQTVSTGLDADNNPSSVQFGIESLYVSEVFPIIGQTDDAVLRLLLSDLQTHSISAFYDSSLFALFLSSPIPDGTRLIWGNTDTGLDFTFSVEGLAAPVPEPDSLLLWLGGLAALAAYRFGPKPRSMERPFRRAVSVPVHAG